MQTKGEKMSLIRQVWLLLLGVVLLALVGSVMVSAVAIRDTLQTELQVKNSDNAASLALALSQQKGDASLIQLLLSAQFDTGHYQSIRWRKPDMSVGFERTAKPRHSVAPSWFVALTPIDVAPGVAQVSSGWNTMGTLELLSHTAFVHDQLWRSTVRTALLLTGLGFVAGLIAMVAVRRIRKPLDRAVDQAKSLVAGSFVTVAESQVPELQRLTHAMNIMVVRLKNVLEAQNSQLEALRIQAQCDGLTGLSHRKHFLGQFESALQREDGPHEAGLVLVRLHDLSGLNLRLGRDAADRVLVAISEALQVYAERVQGCFAGRLNGADFALWLPVPGVASETARALSQALRVSLPAFGAGIRVAMGAVETGPGRNASAWFGDADAALARAEAQEAFAVEFAPTGGVGATQQGERVWRQQLTEAMRERRTRLVQFPVLGRDSAVLHLEVPLRLQLDAHGEYLPAAQWLPLAVRSHLTAEIDVHAMGLALEAIARDGQPRYVNLSPASLLDGGFTARLRDLVFQSPQAARRLGVEVAQEAAIAHFDLLHELGRQLRPLGVKLGVEHAGAGLAQVDRLYQAGLDYVKLDATVVRGVAGDAARAAFVRGMVVMLRSLSLKVYAEGVVEAMDVQALWDCEVDGVTGPWASSQEGTAHHNPPR